MGSRTRSDNTKKKEHSNLETVLSEKDVQNKHDNVDGIKTEEIRLVGEKSEGEREDPKHEELNLGLGDKQHDNRNKNNEPTGSKSEENGTSGNDIHSSPKTTELKGNENASSIDSLNDDNKEFVNKSNQRFELPELEIPFSQRRLSEVRLNKPVDRKLNLHPIDFQFQKVIGFLMESKGFEYTEDFHSQLTDLSIIYFHDLIETLRKFTEVQRRRKPSISDTDLCLREKKIKPSKLYEEYTKTKEISKKNNAQINIINRQTQELMNAFTSSEVKIEEDDPSLPFIENEHYDITELVPKQSSKPMYIPSFLPDLPPDYTYQKTPKYMDMVTDLKQLRLKLVEESRLTEKSLYNLIDDDERKWKEDFETELLRSVLEIEEDVNSENDDSIMSDAGQNERNVSDIETPEQSLGAHETKAIQPVSDNDTVLNSEPMKLETDNATQITTEQNDLSQTKLHIDAKTFDFVAYSKKRHAIQHKKELELEEKRKLREANIFMKAEKYYSPYATLPVTPEVDNYFKNIVQEDFKYVIKSVRIAERNKKRKVEKILQEKARKEKEKEQAREKMGLGFSFGPIGNMLDNEDESDDDEDLGFPNFVFDGDNEPPAKFENTPHEIENNQTYDNMEIDSTTHEHDNISNINGEVNTNAATNMDPTSDLDSDAFEAELEDAIQVESAPKGESDVKIQELPNDIPSDSSDEGIEFDNV